MVKVKVKNINFGEKEVYLKTGIISEIMDTLGKNDDSVIFVDEEGRIYTSDKTVEEGKILNMIEVFSGG